MTVAGATPSVLFVCVHNAGRSQMAAALLRHFAGDRIDVRSAGTEPAAEINPAAVAVMAELGIDITEQTPKVLTAGTVARSDVVITMGCGDTCPHFPGVSYRDWPLDDPAGRPPDIVRAVRDEIAERVRALIAELAPGLPGKPTPPTSGHLTHGMVVEMTDNEVLGQRAAAFLAMHQPGNPVVAPTVWDVWSAKLAVDAGFAALTVGSKPVALSMGRNDGEGMSFTETLERTRLITAAVDVPVSLDIESGYAQSPTTLVEALLNAGVVGCNIEDTVHSEDKRLRSQSEHADYVAALRAAADSAGTHLVINARTDLFMRNDGDDSDRIDRAIARLTACAQAGADVLYPVGFHDAETLRTLASALPKPVNALAAPDTADPASYGPLGIARISFGPLLQAALGKHAAEILGRWR